jgi:large subunit ribosomal protein L25
MIPCEIYSKKGNIHGYGHVNDFIKGIHSPNVYLFNIEIYKEKIQAIVQATQYHPVTDNFLHVDFLALDEKKPVKISLPIELTGSSVGIQKGGKLKVVQRKIKVRGLIKDLPDTIVIDISSLDVGQGIKIEQINIPNVELAEPKQNVIIKISASRATTKE